MIEVCLTDKVNITEPNDAVRHAVSVLRAGGICGLPTETVYGLAADATHGEAVARIFQAKGRPRFNPLICHVSACPMAEGFAVFDPLSRRLAETFWPGPLTLVLPLRDGHAIHPLVSAGLGTIGVRMPWGKAADVIAGLGRPLAAPSANRSGGISPTTADSVRESLGDAVDYVLDDGPSRVGLESTIVEVRDGAVVLLRPGGVSIDAIEHAAGQPVTRRDDHGPVNAPGQLASHYAPRAKMRLDADTVMEGEALLAFGPRRAQGHDGAIATCNLSPRGDLVEAAANLFAMMAELDRSGAHVIAVEPVPAHGLGDAINDRLRRAAAPRPAPADGDHG